MNYLATIALAVVALGFGGFVSLVIYLLLSDRTDEGGTEAGERRPDPRSLPESESAAIVDPITDTPTERLSRLDTGPITPSAPARRFVQHQPHDTGKHHRRGRLGRD